MWGGGVAERRENRRGPIKRAGFWGVVWEATGGGGRREGRSSPHPARFPGRWDGVGGASNMRRG